MCQSQNKITVVIPAYNVGKYISQALDSIYQSSEQSFDVIICDDGSTDNTCDIIEQYRRKHSNITLIKNSTNRGAGYTRAKLMRLVATEFVAFCDADDIVRSERFSKQLEYLHAHPEISVLGSLIQVFYGDDIHNTGNIWQYLEHDTDIKTVLLYDCAVYAPSVMMRTQAIRKTNIEFNANLRMGEDHDYWASLAQFVKFANIQEVLVYYRRHQSQLTHKSDNRAPQIACHIKSCQKMWLYCGINIGDKAAMALCFPQYISPLRVSWYVKKELTALIQSITNTSFAIKVSPLQQRIVLARLFPYVLWFPCIATYLTVYRAIQKNNPTISHIAKLYLRMMLIPLFASRTVRACWWFIIHRVLYK